MSTYSTQSHRLAVEVILNSAVEEVVAIFQSDTEDRAEAEAQAITCFIAAAQVAAMVTTRGATT
jgi:Spy/CpxP family protein refolding chaperone